MEEEKNQLAKRVERLKKRVTREVTPTFQCHNPWPATPILECKQGLR